MKKKLEEEMRNSELSRMDFLNEVKEFVFENSPLNNNPVDNVKWVPLKKVKANDYNPNQVAKNEMGLLYTSIDHDGYTQPVVTIYDKDKDEYVIVDGFHRYSVMKHYKSIRERNKGMLPVVVIEKDINDRMASTVRHNRARGKHSIEGMSKIVFEMLENGWSDAEIIDELGMEMEELLRLKHITGFSKLFEDTEYNRAWETKRQLKLKREYKQKENE